MKALYGIDQELDFLVVRKEWGNIADAGVENFWIKDIHEAGGKVVLNQEAKNIYHPMDWNVLPSITRRVEV